MLYQLVKQRTIHTFLKSLNRTPNQSLVRQMNQRNLEQLKVKQRNLEQLKVKQLNWPRSCINTLRSNAPNVNFYKIFLVMIGQ